MDNKKFDNYICADNYMATSGVITVKALNENRVGATIDKDGEEKEDEEEGKDD